MTAFLFWNMGRGRREAILARLVTLHNVDVAILAECPTPQADMLAALPSDPMRPFRRVSVVAFDRVQVYSRLPPGCFGTPLSEEDHYAIRPLKPPGGIEVLLAVAHLASPMYKSRSDQQSLSRGFAESICAAEVRAKNDRTVVIGT